MFSRELVRLELGAIPLHLTWSRVELRAGQKPRAPRPVQGGENLFTIVH